jgi:hypothetical protein
MLHRFLGIVALGIDRGTDGGPGGTAYDGTFATPDLRAGGTAQGAANAAAYGRIHGQIVGMSQACRGDKEKTGHSLYNVHIHNSR